MAVFILVLLYLGHAVYSFGSSLKLTYKETKYPIVNVNDDSNILVKINNLHNKADCNGLIELYKKVDKDKVARLKLRKKEAYYYARYIGVKGFIRKKLIDLHDKLKCDSLDSNIFSTSDITQVNKKVMEYIELGKLSEAKTMVSKHQWLHKLFKFINTIKSIRHKKDIKNTVLTHYYEHSGTVSLERCSLQKRSYVPRYPESKFFVKAIDSVVFFDGGNMHIYDINNYLNEVLSLYDSIKIESTSHNYVNLKNILGVERSGYMIYITVFSGKFFSGKTVESLGINVSKEHIFNVPTYKVLAFDLYSKKVMWESTVADSFSYLSAATFVDNNLYVMCGELTDRELTNYLCKLNINNGKLLDKIYISTDEIRAIARGKNTVFHFESAKPYKKDSFLYLLLYSGGIVAKYDFNNDLISFVLRFRHNNVLPLPLDSYGEQIWVGEDTFIFFNASHYNFFIADQESGRLLNIISRGVMGHNIKKCFTMGNNYVCVSRNRIFIFGNNIVKVINFGIDDIFINDDEVFIVKNKKVYFAKNLFFSKITQVFKLEKDYYLEELAYTSKYLFIKGIKNGNCIVDVFEKK